MIVAIVAMCVMLAMHNLVAIGILIFIIGFAIANIFGIIFGAALQKLPAKANEISGLMIMGVAGGAIFPGLMGFVADRAGQVGALCVLLCCMIYLLICAFTVREKQA
jgi:fucose permease